MDQLDHQGVDLFFGAQVEQPDGLGAGAAVGALLADLVGEGEVVQHPPAAEGIRFPSKVHASPSDPRQQGLFARTTPTYPAWNLLLTVEREFGLADLACLLGLAMLVVYGWMLPPLGLRKPR